LSPEESPARLVAVLNHYLFGEQSFRGNAVDYYDPRNSYLNDVLDRRTGIPISLSIVYIEVARRVGLPMEGIGFPGHFIVRWPRGSEGLLVDPFNQGAILSEADCAERLRGLYGDRLRFKPDHLRAVTRREIARRMLANLKGCYLSRGDLERARRSVEWSLLVDSSHPEDVRELALIRYRQGDFKRALADLERFLEIQPTGPLAAQTRALVKQVQELWIRRN
jgi:regulator of sirC expression with transglutaminase-like and TPR domain